MPHRPTVVLVITALTLITVLAAATAVARFVRTQRSAIRAFQDAHSPAMINGRTADEIIAAHGPPMTVQRRDDGTPNLILYKDVAHGQYCVIELRNGVAVRVSFSFQ